MQELQSKAQAFWAHLREVIEHYMADRQAKADRQAATLAAVGQVTYRYKGERRMRAAIATMAQHGWRVQTQSSHQPRSGCLRVVMLGGIGALIWKPKEVHTVTFERV
jgi:hypothetical protein